MIGGRLIESEERTDRGDGIKLHSGSAQDKRGLLRTGDGVPAGVDCVQHDGLAPVLAVGGLLDGARSLLVRGATVRRRAAAVMWVRWA